MIEYESIILLCKKIGSGLQQFDLNFVRVKSVLAGSSSVSGMIRVRYDSSRSLLASGNLG